MSGGREGEQPASFQHLVDTMPGAVFLRDQAAVAERRMSYVSPQAERVTGMPPAYWTRPGGLDEFRRRVHPDDYPQQGGLPRFGRTRSAEFRWIRPDGRTRWLRTVSAMLPGTDGLVQALAFD